MVVDLVGVECGTCHEEAFQLFEREVLLKVKVCPRCAYKIDSEQQEKTEEEMLKSMGKAERLQIKKERSREWAHTWHGKHVIIHFEVSNNSLTKVKKKQIRGMAWFGCKNEDSGWGRVKVILDKCELSRITHKENEYHPESYYLAIDGHTHTLDFITHGDVIYETPIAIYVNWGDRFRYILEEVDPEADRLAAKREEERRQREYDEEVARHIGEGI